MLERKYYLNDEETSLEAILEHLQDLLKSNGNTEIWQDLGIDFEDVEILQTINYSNIPYNDFNKWLTEALDYQNNIVFDKEQITEENADYKTLYDIRNVDIEFRKDNTCDNPFEIAVYCKTTDFGSEWEFVDNITENLFKKVLE